MSIFEEYGAFMKYNFVLTWVAYFILFDFSR